LLLIATGERHDALVSGGDTNPYCWLLASSDHRNGSQQPADISRGSFPPCRASRRASVPSEP